MEYNEEEAIRADVEKKKKEATRALDIADEKLMESNYYGAKYFVNRAQNLDPKVDGLKEYSRMIDVYICASNGGEESDWYGILGVDPSANNKKVRKQYKDVALLVHPDKNKSKAAEGAFKLVSDALCVLSDNSKRIAYDRKRKSKQKKSDAASHSSKAAYHSSKAASHRSKAAYHNSKAASNASKAAAKEAQEKVKRWLRESREKLASAVAAAAARGNANEAERLFKRPKTAGYAYDQKRKSKEVKEEKSHASSASDSTKEAEERVKRWLEESREKLASAVAAAAARGNANEADRLFERPTTTGYAYDQKKEVKEEKSDASDSTKEAEERVKRWLEESREKLASAVAEAARGNANEAERLFKNPITSGYGNCSLEAHSLFKKPMTYGK